MVRLIESIEDHRDRLIVRTIYATGVRVSELCAMNIGDIDFEDETIKVRGKGGKIRIVFVDHDTLEDMSTFIGNRIDGPLFLGQQGHHISPRSVQHIFKQYAPPGITPHKIRHSYASELLPPFEKSPGGAGEPRTHLHQDHRDLPPYRP